MRIHRMARYSSKGDNCYCVFRDESRKRAGKTMMHFCAIGGCMICESD